MDIKDGINARRSIRKYKHDEVDRSIINELIAAAIKAPSAKNRQPWKFIVYTGAAKARLIEAMKRGLERESEGEAVLPDSSFGLPDARRTVRIMREAPVVIIVLNTNGLDPYEDICTDKRISEICDSLAIGAAIENLILRAGDFGLGTLWIANTCFAYPELVVEIGTEHQLVGAVAVGYPAESPHARPRKELADVLEYRS